MDKYEYVGEFWLPDQKERKLYGKFSFDREGGGLLELKDKFIDDNESHTYPFINGLSLSNEKLTLIDSFDKSWPVREFPGNADSTVYANSFIRGTHISTAGDYQLTELKVKHSKDFARWLLPLGPVVATDGTFKLTEKINKKYTIEKHGFSIEIVGGVTWKAGADEAHYDIDSVVTILSQNAKPYEFFDMLTYQLQNFFTLIIGVPITASGYSGKLATTSEQFECFSVPIYEPKSRKWSRDKVFMPSATALKSLGTTIGNWCDLLKDKDFQSVIDLLYIVNYDDGLRHEIRLLLLTQTLEAIHRRVEGGYYTDPAEYEKARQALTSAIPPTLTNDHKMSLNKRLEFGNEFSQRKRLGSLISNVWGEVMNEYIVNKNDFVDEVSNIRNYLVHYARGVARPYEGIQLIAVNKRLKLLLITCLCKQLGFDMVNVRNALSYLSEYREIKRS